MKRGKSLTNKSNDNQKYQLSARVSSALQPVRCKQADKVAGVHCQLGLDINYTTIDLKRMNILPTTGPPPPTTRRRRKGWRNGKKWHLEFLESVHPWPFLIGTHMDWLPNQIQDTLELWDVRSKIVLKIHMALGVSYPPVAVDSEKSKDTHSQKNW